MYILPYLYYINFLNIASIVNAQNKGLPGSPITNLLYILAIIVGFPSFIAIPSTKTSLFSKLSMPFNISSFLPTELPPDIKIMSHSLRAFWIKFIMSLRLSFADGYMIGFKFMFFNWPYSMYAFISFILASFISSLISNISSPVYIIATVSFS